MDIQCPKCKTDNPDTLKFCGECGTQLPSLRDIDITKTIEATKEELTRGTTFAGRYEIIEELGAGGMGRVYRVEDTKLKQETALKLIKPEIAADKRTIERFRNELKIARNIRHKNVCGMYDLGEEQGAHYITMEYVRGEDLKNMIIMSGQLGIGTAISIAKQVCEGLAEADKLGVIHRDLKPSNVMIDREGNVRIMDFGIARSLKERGITGAGVIMGTPEYMSPEQAEGKDVDRRSDIYSLGTILYEMVTGRVPFEGDTGLAIAVKHKTEEPKNPREFNTQLSEDLSRLILKCLEKDKDNRYQSAEELRSGLENVERSIPTTERAAPPKKPLTSKEITVTFRTKRLLIPALIIIIIALVGLFLWYPWSRFESPSSDIDKPSIAVLPFEDLSPQKDQGYLCVGLAESLINALSRIKDLRVPARTSSFSFQGKDQMIRDIGEKLGVKTLLVGSLQRSGNRIRITTQLVNAADESLLWSEQYNRELDDVFDIQDEISSNIVETLNVKLVAGESAGLTKRETTNTEAYQLYLQGRYFRWIENKENFLKAKDYFAKAIDKDPKYSSAYAGLAEIYMLLGLFAYMPRDEADQKAKNAAQRALELDDNSSEAHASMGVILEVFDWKWEEAEREFKRAIELNPNYFNAHYEYGLLLARLKRHNEAEVELKTSLRIDPLQSMAYSHLGSVYRLKGDVEKAEEQYKKRDELRPPIVSEEDPVEGAKRLIDRDGRLPQHLRALSIAYMQYGQEAEARMLLNELERLYEESDIGNIAYHAARVYIYLDDKDQALTWLERAYEKRDPVLTAINTSTVLDPLRQESRFKSILAKMGFE
jgi:serine/threonine protein kinase/Tfp pilus assembly protein PilF